MKYFVAFLSPILFMLVIFYCYLFSSFCFLFFFPLLFSLFCFLFFSHFYLAILFSVFSTLSFVNDRLQ